VRFLAAVANQQVRIAGKIDPVNLIMLENQPLTTNRDGTFDILIPLPANRRIAVTVTTPLGKKQEYELAVP
jgi:hypothetical protein